MEQFVSTDEMRGRDLSRFPMLVKYPNCGGEAPVYHVITHPKWFGTGPVEILAVNVIIDGGENVC